MRKETKKKSKIKNKVAKTNLIYISKKCHPLESVFLLIDVICAIYIFNTQGFGCNSDNECGQNECCIIGILHGFCFPKLNEGSLCGFVSSDMIT